MIYSTLIGTYNVELMPLDITKESVVFHASAHNMKSWYITIDRSGITEHVGDDEPIIPPIWYETTNAQCDKLSKFAIYLAGSLMTREIQKSNKRLNQLEEV